MSFKFKNQNYKYSIVERGQGHTAKLTIKEAGLVEIYFSERKDARTDRLEWNYIPLGTRIFHIGRFYNTSDVRGIGKAFLIFVLTKWLDEDDFVILEASGDNNLSLQIQRNCIKHRLSLDEIMNELLLKYPTQLYSICHENVTFNEKQTRKSLHEYLCRCIAAEGLVKHYKSMGFKLLQPSISSDSWMGARVSNLHA